MNIEKALDPTSQLTALVVEDEPFFSGISQRILAEFGIRSCVATDAAEAGARLRAQRFDLILLDLRLPGGDGLELLAEIEGDPALASRTIVVTAYPNVAKMFDGTLPIIEKSRIVALRDEILRITGTPSLQT